MENGNIWKIICFPHARSWAYFIEYVYTMINKTGYIIDSLYYV